MAARSTKCLVRQQGFTLIEMITVIIVLGIVGIGLGGFIRGGFGIYSDASGRQQILNETRFAVERLNRELRSAIPNSLRLRYDAAAPVQCLQYVPAEWVGYYTRLPLLPDTTNQLRVVEFADNNDQFIWQPGDFAFVYPTSNADIYLASRQKRQITQACSDAVDADLDGQPDGDGDCNTADSSSHTATFTLAGAFADASPASRVYFGRKAVSICARAQGLYRYEESLTEDQPLHTEGGELLAEHLANQLDDSTQLPFELAPPTLNRNGLVHILLRFERNQEPMNYNLEVHVPNVP